MRYGVCVCVTRCNVLRCRDVCMCGCMDAWMHAPWDLAAVCERTKTILAAAMLRHEVSTRTCMPHANVRPGACIPLRAPVIHNICMYAYIYIYTHYIYIYIYIYIYVCIRVYVYIYIYIYVYVYIYIYIYTYIHTYIHTYIYIYIYIYIHTFIHDIACYNVMWYSIVWDNTTILPKARILQGRSLPEDFERLRAQRLRAM